MAVSEMVGTQAVHLPLKHEGLEMTIPAKIAHCMNCNKDYDQTTQGAAEQPTGEKDD